MQYQPKKYIFITQSVLMDKKLIITYNEVWGITTFPHLFRFGPRNQSSNNLG